MTQSNVRTLRGRQFQRMFEFWWPADWPEIRIHMECIRRGGQWKTRSGKTAGLGLHEHFKQLICGLWPEIKWNKWIDLILQAYLNHSYIAVMGCSASGKTFSSAAIVLADWLCFPNKTTVLCSTTDVRSLDLRIWGNIRQLFISAKKQYNWLPGKLNDSKRRIVYQADDDQDRPEQFKNGIVGVPCKQGDKWVGLGAYVGIHNTRVRVIADEANLMPRAYLDADSNLSKCQDYKLIALGNPTGIDNAHGILCEPVDGWDSAPDKEPVTKTWPTRYGYPRGICVHLPGPDTPNKDTPPGEQPPFPFLITPAQIENDKRKYHPDDVLFLAMDLGVMPRGSLGKRIITRDICERGRAFDQPNWVNPDKVIRYAGLDAAYGGVGGTRCVIARIAIGEDSSSQNQSPVVAIEDVQIIPMRPAQTAGTPEDQIVQWCKQYCTTHGITPDRFFFDAGMRSTLVAAFARGWSPAVQPIDCSGKPSDMPVSASIPIPASEYYSKRITEMWYTVRLLIQSGQLRGLTQEILNEFNAREFKVVAGNKIELESKEDMIKRTGFSPDLADAVAIAIYGARMTGLIIGGWIGRTTDQVNTAFSAIHEQIWLAHELDYFTEPVSV